MGKMYSIREEPFETVEDTYKRGWFIIRNYDRYKYPELHSRSIEMLNTSRGMTY